MTAERKAALMAYCRIDELTADEEPLFEGIYQAAVSYMEQAGIAGPEAGTPRRGQYDLCVNALVLDSWDRRGAVSEARSGHTMTDNVSFRHLLNQLKLTEPADPLDTGP
ncbi:phage gp6-like head-tail connector protein [Colidextribacter sp. OB.20]|nr:phage gp6-like head-tail connector protein [Colidextribacter sp. OB.20]